MLDVGYPVDAIKGLPLLARTAGLVAHLYEEIAAADRLHHVEPRRRGDHLRRRRRQAAE